MTDTQKQPSPDEYGTFVKGIELTRVRMVRSHVEAPHPISDASAVNIELENETGFRVHEEVGSFEAVSRFDLTFEEDGVDEPVGTISVTYSFLYESDMVGGEEDLDPYFEIFAEVSLPVNVWPFAREFVHNATSRVDWPKLDLPLLKAGLDK
jgi:preprotein translocase subunit SecB